MLVAAVAAAALMPASATAATSGGGATGGAVVPAASEPAAPQSPASPPPVPESGAGAESGSGGARYAPELREAGARSKQTRKRRDRPVLASFQVSRTAVFAYGQPATINYQVNDRSRYVRVRLAFVREGSPGATYRYDLGRKRTGIPQTFRWRGLSGQDLATQGAYHFRLTASDSKGNRIVRSSESIGGAPIQFRDHRFPVLGPHTFGGPDARFGVPRPGHKHQGQDIPAAAGTPVVAPRAGMITWRAYQASGAGYYLVLAGQGEPYNYVFMHLKAGSILVKQGDLVKTGQQLAQIGNTGESEGPHLHFEIWDGPWSHGGHPIDPLPMLKVWDAYS